MLLKVNWLSILLIFTLTLCILPSNVCATDLESPNISIPSKDGSFYVDDISKVPAKIMSDEVKNWIKDHTNIDPNNFKFELLTEKKKLNDKSNIIKFYDKNNHELYYALTPGTTTIVESNPQGAKNTYLPTNIATHFSIMNGLQIVTSKVSVNILSYVG